MEYIMLTSSPKKQSKKWLLSLSQPAVGFACLPQFVLSPRVSGLSDESWQPPVRVIAKHTPKTSFCRCLRKQESRGLHLGFSPGVPRRRGRLPSTAVKRGAILLLASPQFVGETAVSVELSKTEQNTRSAWTLISCSR